MREDIALQHPLCGHNGENKMGTQPPQRYFWPRLSGKYQEDHQRVPGMSYHEERPKMRAKRYAVPYPMHTLSADFKGPTDSNHYIFAVVDLYSKWPECYIMTTTSFTSSKSISS